VTEPALHGRLLPTEQQRLLLRCAVGDAAHVARAWDAARRGMDFDRLDEGSHGLLPLVYRALVAAGVEDPLMPRLKGIYRKAWFANQLLIDALRQPLGRLDYEGAEPILLHGAALMTGFYPERALRRIPCLDVAVRPGTEERALRGLERSGWTRHPEGDGTFPVPLLDAGGRLLLLHAGLPEAMLAPALADGGQEAVWARAREIDVAGFAARVLEPTDQLLSVCAVGPDLALDPQPAQARPTPDPGDRQQRDDRQEEFVEQPPAIDLRQDEDDGREARQLQPVVARGRIAAHESPRRPRMTPPPLPKTPPCVAARAPGTGVLVSSSRTTRRLSTFFMRAAGLMIRRWAMLGSARSFTSSGMT
jgi:hypothetical protein